jgi:4-amino-4-deoxy-L-arabinose transferase-like glycosyltransferase
MLSLLALAPILIAITLPLLGAAGGVGEHEQERWQRALVFACGASIALLAVRAMISGSIFQTFISMLCACALVLINERRSLSPGGGHPAQLASIAFALALASSFQGALLLGAAILLLIALIYQPMLIGLRALTGTEAPFTPPKPAAPPAKAIQAPVAAPIDAAFDPQSLRGKPTERPLMQPIDGDRTRGS